MPHRNQSNQQGRSYASEAGRFLAADLDPVPIIHGIEDYERALAYHREAHKHDASERVKRTIAKRLQELQDD